MGSFAVQTGRALRRVRRARRLTLRDLPGRSHGGFKASAVAAYERADRNISLERFCGLCRVYDVDPARLLADVLREVEGRQPVLIDRARLEAIPPPDREIFERFASQVRTLRDESDTDGLRIRTGDLEVLATAAGRREDEFLDVLSPASRRPSASTSSDPA